MSDLREKVARAINGPHDPTHIGAQKLDELQRHRWYHQTSENERNYALQRADAAIAAMPDPMSAASDTLEWYAETFCEHPDNEVCGRLSDGDCAGCRARVALQKG